MAKNKVILTGFMGCGKSTIGRILAEKRGQELLDTDRYIEQKQGRSISDIFATQGEEVFRDMETEALRELIQKQEPMVIALGGGLPIGGNLYGEEPVRQRALLRGERNRELLAELGYVFYLKITPEEVYRRLKGQDLFYRRRILIQGSPGFCSSVICGMKNARMRSSPLRVRINGSLRMKLSVNYLE